MCLILALVQQLVCVVVRTTNKEIGRKETELADVDDPAPFSAWNSRMSSNVPLLVGFGSRETCGTYLLGNSSTSLSEPVG